MNNNTDEIKYPTEVLGIKLDEKAIEKLKNGEETDLVEGLISKKTGKPFSAYLSLNENNQVKYRFPPREKTSRQVSKEIPKTIGGVELEPDDIEELESGRETKLIMGLESKKKGKFYDAYLRWSPEKGMLFRFPGQDL